jgi:hypothetical protein
MPSTSIRDLVIKDDDLVVGTHGRSFWILDDIIPLRQIQASYLGILSRCIELAFKHNTYKHLTISATLMQ